MNTAKILASMLKENTGINFLDSGGTPKYDENGNYIGLTNGYGRSYERNQHSNFEQEEETSYSFHHGKIEVTHNVYHWLKGRLNYNENLTNLFGVFCEGDDDKSWLQLMEEFPEWLGTHMAEENNDESYQKPGGIYGEGKPFTINTHNGQDLLSQTIQYTYWTCQAGEFIALQIHGGADVRGGYTVPRIFETNGVSELAIFDNAKATTFCTGKDHHPTAIKLKERQERQEILPGFEVANIDFDGYNEHYWYSDDGYNWYEQSACGGGYTNLREMETKNLNDESVENPGEWEQEKLCYDDDGNGYCPICGAKLAVG